jgi:hypothetical protein
VVRLLVTNYFDELTRTVEEVHGPRAKWKKTLAVFVDHDVSNIYIPFAVYKGWRVCAARYMLHVASALWVAVLGRKLFSSGQYFALGGLPSRLRCAGCDRNRS